LLNYSCMKLQWKTTRFFNLKQCGNDKV
jgi:hypothetical protein